MPIKAIILSLCLLAALCTRAADEQKIDSIVSQMTLEEKVGLCYGNFMHFRGVERLNIPEVGWCDGPRGPNGQGGSTAFPSGILMGATWNPETIEKAGAVMGEESRAIDRRILLGPACNILRDPLCGRFFEYYTEDPCLNSAITAAQIKGIQSQGVAACLKHYACNNRENNRNDYMSVIDDRTMHEIYLPAFKAAVQKADIQTIMTSANGMNYEFVSDSRKMLTDILKNRWGFRGFVMTDWLQTRSTEKAAWAGLDVSMPGGDGCGFGTPLLEAVKAGRVPMEVIDDKVRRVLRVYDFIGILDREDRTKGAGFSTPENHRIALETARQGITLLKNDRNALPLNEKKLKNVLVIGPNADKRFCMGGMGGSSWMESPYEVTVLKGLRNILGDNRVSYISFDDLGGYRPVKAEVSPGAEGFAAQYFAKGSGTPAATDTIGSIDFMWEMKSPTPALTAEEFGEARFEMKFMAPVDGKYSFRFTAGGGLAFVYNNEWAGAPVTIAGKFFEPVTTADLDLRKGEMLRLCIIYRRESGDAALRVEWQGPDTEFARGQWNKIDKAAKRADAVVFVGGIDHSIDTEGRDKTSLAFSELQTRVIQRIASVNPNTHVVLINGSPLEISDWLPSVASLTEAWYPGMEGGTAVAEALLGRINPSGRMPFTWAKRLDDYPCRRFAREDALNVLYTERLNVGYRYFDTADTAPLFPFGYGLSYTTFDYSGLTAAATPEGHGALGSVRVSNTGSRDGWETVQIYVRPLNPSVERPAHELKFFRKLFIPAGAAADVDFSLDSDAFSVYDVTQGDWRLDPGKYAIEVCRDSRTPLLSTNIEIR